uniref:Putative secreted protein n=1 Tax=Anopheles darlingi TaxID=43151 RepID=A0A2M4D1L3_ANODA
MRAFCSSISAFCFSIRAFCSSMRACFFIRDSTIVLIEFSIDALLSGTGCLTGGSDDTTSDTPVGLR